MHNAGAAFEVSSIINRLDFVMSRNQGSDTIFLAPFLVITFLPPAPDLQTLIGLALGRAVLG